MIEEIDDEDENTVSVRLVEVTGDEGPEPTIVQHDGNVISYPNCLLLSTERSSSNPSAVVANIDHYTEVTADFPWKIQQVTRDPLAFPEAIKLAREYARANHVPVVLVGPDGFSSDSERRQTDTTVIEMRRK
jgi:hypothetical protein